jgi:hypothetical protein
LRETTTRVGRGDYAEIPGGRHPASSGSLLLRRYFFGSTTLARGRRGNAQTLFSGLSYSPHRIPTASGFF